MSAQNPVTGTASGGARTLQLILAWSFVGIPFIWGVLETLRNAMKLFH